jgi:hypothetical protein
LEPADRTREKPGAGQLCNRRDAARRAGESAPTRCGTLPRRDVTAFARRVGDNVTRDRCRRLVLLFVSLE